MNGRTSNDRTLLVVAVAAALAAGLCAVDQHASCTTAGYALAVAQREGEECRRMADAAERRVAAARTTQATMARAKDMKIPLDWPRTWNVVRASTLAAGLAAQQTQTPGGPAQGGDR